MEETYTKISETEVKITRTQTSVVEEIVSIDKLNADLKKIDDELIEIQKGIDIFTAEKTAERNAILAKMAELEKVGVVSATTGVK